MPFVSKFQLKLETKNLNLSDHQSQIVLGFLTFHVSCATLPACMISNEGRLRIF